MGPGELAETKWISFCVLMILELLLFGVPIILIGYLQKNKNVYYFGLSATIFLQGFVVTQFIFAPKIYYLHFDRNADNGERFARTSEINDRHFMQSVNLQTSAVMRSSVNVTTQRTRPVMRSPTTARNGSTESSLHFIRESSNMDMESVQ